MQAQLGFDWSSLIGAGANIASGINSAISGSPTAPTYGVTGTTGASLTSSPYFWPLVLGSGLVVLLMMQNKK